MKPVGIEVEVIWGGRRVRAFVPALLEDRDLALDVPTAARTAAAAAEVAHAAEALVPDFEPLARLLCAQRASLPRSSKASPLRSSMSSSPKRISDEERPGAAAWVASNLAVVAEAVADAEAKHDTLARSTLRVAPNPHDG